MGRPEKSPHPLSGLNIAKGECPECGKGVVIKANKNGIGYFYCNWPDMQTGERCNHQTRYSRKYSDQLIAKFTNKKGIPNEQEVANDNRPPKPAAKPEPANDNSRPEPDSEPNFLGS